MATWTTAYVNDLPDSAFACPEQRKYPHHDASGKLDLPHLRAALSRIGDPNNEQCGKAHLQAHARAEGMGNAKALMPIKAKPLDEDEETAFWDGKVPRRLLAIPFGGPIPSPKSKLGVDLDGEFFSERTDIYGPYPELKQDRTRLVDWHHSYQPPTPKYGDPTGMMMGHLIGKSILDPDPDEDGWWVDFWLEAGNKRVSLIKRLAERGAQLYGSSQPAKGGGRVNPETGEITVWPFLFETLSTSPQNTYSVMRPKGLLDGANEYEVSDGLKALYADLAALSDDLTPTSLVREESASAARQSLNDLSTNLDRLAQAITRKDFSP